MATNPSGEKMDFLGRITIFVHQNVVAVHLGQTVWILIQQAFDKLINGIFRVIQNVLGFGHGNE